MELPNRILLAPDSVFPSVVQTRDDGGLQFNFQAENLTLSELMLPSGVTRDNFQDFIVDAVLGKWTCITNNTFGDDSATSTVTDCGKTLFQSNNCVHALSTLFHTTCQQVT